MKSPRTRHVLLATVVLAVMISPFAVAATGSVLRENGRNPTATSETQIVGRIAGTDNNTGGDTTPPSKLSPTPGGGLFRLPPGGEGAKRPPGPAPLGGPTPPPRPAPPRSNPPPPPP